MEKPSEAKLGTEEPEIVIPPQIQQPLAGSTTPAAAPGIAAMHPGGPIPTLEEHHAKFAEEVHHYIRQYIRNADQKAAFFFAASTALLAFLNGMNGASRWLKDIRTWSFVDGLAFVAMAGLAGSACVLLSVIFPRLKGSRKGILYFRAIAEHESSAEYTDEIIRHGADAIIRSKLRHDYDLSKVCTSKYRVLRIGFWIGSVGAIAALLFLLLARAG